MQKITITKDINLGDHVFVGAGSRLTFQDDLPLKNAEGDIIGYAERVWEDHDGLRMVFRLTHDGAKYLEERV